MTNPRNWNHYSVLLEVAVCMTAYAILALDMENMPPFLERIYRGGDPAKNAQALKIFNFMQKTFPFGIALAFLLPSMHQSSLGSLMYLAGPRVNTLWQTPMLPLLYLVMAYILGFACVLLVLPLSAYFWDLGWDSVILGNSPPSCRGSPSCGWSSNSLISFIVEFSEIFTFDSYSVSSCWKRRCSLSRRWLLSQPIAIHPVRCSA